jgi:hypothetical protein
VRYPCTTLSAPRSDQLAQRAVHHGGVFHLDQFLAWGLSASAVHKRTTAGRLHRIHRCVYSLVPMLDLGAE